MVASPSLPEITSRTLTVFPHAERIVLFGSRGRGVPAFDSDFDLLVVTPTLLPPAKRTAQLRLALRGLDASFDLIVVTPDEYARLRSGAQPAPDHRSDHDADSDNRSWCPMWHEHS